MRSLRVSTAVPFAKAPELPGEALQHAAAWHCQSLKYEGSGSKWVHVGKMYVHKVVELQLQLDITRLTRECCESNCGSLCLCHFQQLLQSTCCRSCSHHVCIDGRRGPQKPELNSAPTQELCLDNLPQVSRHALEDLWTNSPPGTASCQQNSPTSVEVGRLERMECSTPR